MISGFFSWVIVAQLILEEYFEKIIKENPGMALLHHWLWAFGRNDVWLSITSR